MLCKPTLLDIISTSGQSHRAEIRLHLDKSARSDRYDHKHAGLRSQFHTCMHMPLQHAQKHISERDLSWSQVTKPSKPPSPGPPSPSSSPRDPQAAQASGPPRPQRQECHPLSPLLLLLLGIMHEAPSSSSLPLRAALLGAGGASHSPVVLHPAGQASPAKRSRKEAGFCTT